MGKLTETSAADSAQQQRFVAKNNDNNINVCNRQSNNKPNSKVWKKHIKKDNTAATQNLLQKDSHSPTGSSNNNNSDPAANNMKKTRNRLRSRQTDCINKVDDTMRDGVGNSKYDMESTDNKKPYSSSSTMPSNSSTNDRTVNLTSAATTSSNRSNNFKSAREDIVGKRLLCLTNFQIDAPSPTVISSALWSVIPSKNLTSQSQGDHQSDDTSQIPKWCPIHHHHDYLRRNYSNLSNTSTSDCVNANQNGHITSNPNYHQLATVPKSHNRLSCSLNSSTTLNRSINNIPSYTAAVMTNCENSLIKQLTSCCGGDSLAAPSQQTNSKKSSKSTLLECLCKKTVPLASNNLLASKFYRNNRPTENPMIGDTNAKHRDENVVSYCRDLHRLDWRSGTIRAASHRDLSNKDLSILVEFDKVDWQQREWIRVYDSISSSSSESAFSSNNTSQAYSPSDKNVNENCDIQTSKSSKKSSKISNIDCTQNNQANDKSTRLKKESSASSIDTQDRNLFEVLLIEDSIVCVKRRFSPAGIDKLWPALVSKIFFTQV